MKTKIKYTFLVLVVVFSLYGCSWEDFVNDAVNGMTTYKPINVSEFLNNIFGKPTLVPIAFQDFQGVTTEFSGFTNYYMRYEVDKKETLLNTIESIPTVSSLEIKSDMETCISEQKTDNNVQSAFISPPDDLSQLSFWHPDEIKEPEYFSCLRFPWLHVFLFDKKSNIVYHVVLQTKG